MENIIGYLREISDGTFYMEIEGEDPVPVLFHKFVTLPNTNRLMALDGRLINGVWVVPANTPFFTYLGE